VSSARGIAAPPYVGYAVDGALLGPTAASLAAWYDAAGITASPDWHDLVDHVAAVAEAGTLLLAAGRPDAASVLVREYLGPWFERYAAAVEAADDSGFYGPLTRFLANAVVEVERATRA
jgi:putative dimethyl sulfoxide reductase chaperone